MRILICEDEKQYSDAVVSAIQRWQKKEGASVSIDLFHSSEELLESIIKKQNYDLAFLDIQFPHEVNGLEVAEVLKKINEQIVLVFISSYREYAVDGYKVNALRFLCKPFSDAQIFECLDIAMRQWKLTSGSFLFLETKQQAFKLPYKSICYFESRAHYLTVQLVNSTNPAPTVRQKLSVMLSSLPNELFVQCHQSYIVNLLYVQSISRTQVFLVDGTALPMSMKYRENLLAKFKAFFQGEAI